MSLLCDTWNMKYKIKTSEQFDKWFGKLKDIKAKARMTLRLRQVSTGHFGDHKLISQNLCELRFFFGSGYRVYYTIKNGQVVYPTLTILDSEKSIIFQQHSVIRAVELLSILQKLK